MNLIELRETWDPAFVSREKARVASAKAGNVGENDNQVIVPRVQDGPVAVDMAISMNDEFLAGINAERIGHAVNAIIHYNNAHANARKIYFAHLMAAELTSTS